MMKTLQIISLIIVAAFLLGCDNDNVNQPLWEAEVEMLKTAVVPFRDFKTAENTGYSIKATEYREQMGYHYLNAGLLDASFEIGKPEVLIYVNGPDGNLKLVAVEYGIPIQNIDNPSAPPEGFTGNDDVWKVDTEFQLWTLHVWVEMENPDGIFTPRNPMLP